MAEPRFRDVEALKRLARYLVGKPRMITNFKRQEEHNGIVGWSDSDWAGCAETRKSTSGGLLCLGKHTVKCWSVIQSVLALSSGEAEFYALVKAASQGLGLRAMLDDLGVGMRLKIMDKKIRIKTDASAARGMALRKGLGPVRHIEVGQLWIQDKVNSGDIGIEKIGGKTNLADTLTKHSDSGSLETHISGTCLQFGTGRHHEAPDVAGDEVIENIDWGANEEADERCGTDQKGNREGVMGRLSMCARIGTDSRLSRNWCFRLIDRLRDATQQQGVDFEGRNCRKGASGTSPSF
jgi:hypothetical protein